MTPLSKVYGGWVAWTVKMTVRENSLKWAVQANTIVTHSNIRSSISTKLKE